MKNVILLITLFLTNIIIVSAFRLPTTIRPTEFIVELIIFPENNTYVGTVTIDFIPEVNGTDIQLHAAEKMDLFNMDINYYYTRPCTIKEFDNETEIVTITCPPGYVAGKKSTLFVEFQNFFSLDQRGLFKTSYQDLDGDVTMVSSRFAPSYARRAFPCFDEPGFKPTFEFLITYPRGYQAKTNSPIRTKRNSTYNTERSEFRVTPKMSISHFNLLISKHASKNESGDFNVWSAEKYTEYTVLSKNYGLSLLETMENLTGISYKSLGINQSHQVAIVDYGNDDQNWGLNFYSEENLLDEGNLTSVTIKQSIVKSLSRKLSSSWFGNVVTSDWWSNFWIDSGLTYLMQYYLPDKIGLEAFDLEKQFVVDVIQRGLQSDSWVHTVPLSGNNNDSNILNRLDSKSQDLTNFKGASVYWMIRQILGPNNFEKGLKIYLDTYKYDNSNPAQLLAALGQVMDDSLNLASVTDAWIYESGFPLITATLDSSGTTVTVTQEKFVIPLKNESNPVESSWHVPLTFTTSLEPNFNQNYIQNWVLPDDSLQINLNTNFASTDDWLIFNLQQTGFYRVNYDDTLWNKIITALKDNSKRSLIHVLNRAQLVDDIFNVARIGKVKYSTAFELVEFLKGETEYYPWLSALNALSFIRGKLIDEYTEDLLKNKTLTLLNQAFPEIVQNSSPDSHTDVLRDILILDWKCQLGDKNCTDYAVKIFYDFKISNRLPDYNYRRLIFCHALVNTPDIDTDFNYLFDMFRNSNSTHEKVDILSSLACTRNETLLMEILRETTSDWIWIKKQDSKYIFESIVSNKFGLDVFLTFLESDLSKIARMYKGYTTFTDLLINVAHKVTTAEEITRVKSLITSNSDIEEVQMIKDEVLNVLDATTYWSATYSEQVSTILRSHSNSIRSETITYLLIAIFCFLISN